MLQLWPQFRAPLVLTQRSAGGLRVTRSIFWRTSARAGHSPSTSDSRLSPDQHQHVAAELHSDGQRGEGTAHHPTPTAGAREGWRQRLRELCHLLRTSLGHFVAVIDSAWARAGLVLAFVLALCSAVCNLVLVPTVNSVLLPEWEAQASTAMMRKVRLGRCQGVSLMGLTGVGPLLQVGATSVGPGPVERSSLVAAHGAALYVEPVMSLVQQQLVLSVVVDSPAITVVQGDGFSWMGFPNDTEPSSRDIVPGLTRQKQAAAQVRHVNDEDEDAGVHAAAEPVSGVAMPQVGQHEEAAGHGQPMHHVPVALGCLTVVNAKVAVLVQSERMPRFFEHIRGQLKLRNEYRSLELHLEGLAHARHPLSRKCTVVSAYSKRHLRHVTPGAQQPAGWFFGCDVLPEAMRPALRIQHTTQRILDHPGAAVRTPLLPAGSGATHGSSSGEPAFGAPKDAAPLVDSGGAGVQVDCDTSVAAQDGASAGQPPESLLPWLCWVHDVVQPLQGRQADQALTSGQPLHYTLRSHGVLMSPRESQLLWRAEATHRTALQTGDPHDWSWLGFEGWSWRAAHGVVLVAGSGSSASLGAWAGMQGHGEVGATPPLVHLLGPPTGGHIEVHLVADHINTPDVWPHMSVTLRVTDLDAPLVERLLELPMDVHQGLISGELTILTYDKSTWTFPELRGRVRCANTSLHFWDAADDLLGCGMELVFEGDRVYLHGARGWFGAVPLAVTGDLDLNPETGSYRLSASALPGVEVNALRATLGIRPAPQPVAGALRGVMHCTGPLEHPVFSGTAVAVSLGPGPVAHSEDTPARLALTSTPGAVGGFDRVPIMSASAVFTLDTSTQRFTLHSAQVVPSGGGQVSGQGTMWVAPEAEDHPDAINMVFEASSVDAGTLMSCYLPPDVREQLPTGSLASLGPAQVRGAMTGSHLAPEVVMQATLPSDSRLVAAGTAILGPSAISFSARGPALSLDASVCISTPHQALLKEADTQAEASHWARPRFEGVDLVAWVRDLDLLPLTRTASAPALDPVSMGQPLHARLSGNVRCSLRPVSASQQDTAVAAGGAPRPRGPSGLAASHPSLMFVGPMQLSSIRVNSLELVRQLSGQLGVSSLGKILLSASTRGTAMAATPSPAALPSAHPAGQAGLYTMGRSGPQDTEALELEVAAPDLLPALNLDPSWVHQVAQLASPREQDEVADSRFQLRHGGLLLDASSANAGREYRLAVAGLPLDEIEAGSLRGSLSSATLEANMEARQGRASLSLDSLKYASLAAERLSGSMRWEGDVVKLEETVLIQQGSRYEVAGEVFLPEHLAAPSPSPAAASGPALAALPRPGGSTAAPASPPGPSTSRASGPPSKGPVPPPEHRTAEAAVEPDATGGARNAGRWRLAVHVPAACVQDLLPATQLLSATQQPGRDYGSAKASFLTALDTAGMRVASPAALGLPPGSGAHTALLDAAMVAPGAHVAGRSPGAAGAAPGTVGAGGSASVLPALQELSGLWSGSIQVWGDSQGASNVEFNLKGRKWRWGAWRLDSLTAVGAADADEGLVLEELSCASGPALASVRGALLGARQDASLLVTNFPLAMLEPLYTALPPALQGVAPAPADSRLGNGVLRPFAGLSRRLETSMARLSARLLREPGQVLTGGTLGRGEVATPGGRFGPSSNSSSQGPVSGLVFVDGWLGGTPLSPEARVDVTVEHGAVGATRLQRATARLTLDARRHVVASVQLVPADMEGSVSLRGTLALDSSSRADVAGAGASPGAPAPPAGAQGSEAGWVEDMAARSGGAQEQHVDALVSVRDGGMAVLCALLPGVQWQAGSAAVDVHVRGALARPGARGSVHLSNATVLTPVLKHPLTHLRTDIEFSGGHMVLRVLDAKVGKSGHLHGMGALPLTPNHGMGNLSSDQDAAEGNEEGGRQRQRGGEASSSGRTSQAGAAGRLPEELSIMCEGLDLRLANVYSGSLDASLLVEGSLLAPSLGGSITFSRGTLNLQAPSQPTASATSPPLPAGSSSSRADWGAPSSPSGDSALVRSAFALLKAGRKRAALSATAASMGTFLPGQQDTAEAVSRQSPTLPPAHQPPSFQAGVPSPAATSGLQLSGLQVMLGPELRATFPVVLNVTISGQVSLSGPADPALLAPSGALLLDNGTLNLVATQFVLDREHTNRLLFLPESGLLDPVLDVVLLSGDLRAVIAGKGSAWQDVLTLSAAGTPLTAPTAGPQVQAPPPGTSAATSASASAGASAAASGAPGGGGPGSTAGGSGGPTAGAAGGGGSAAGILSGRKAGSERVVGPGGAVGSSVAGAAGSSPGSQVLEPYEVARVFEERLADALLGDNGQLALRSLASSTLHTLLPKLETRGQLGAARWRLVGAPALPNLLGVLDVASGPDSGPESAALDPAKLLSRLAVGTELELMWGSSLTAALQHKLLSDSKIGTEARLTYRCTDHVRLNLQLQGLARPSVTLTYNSEPL